MYLGVRKLELLAFIFAVGVIELWQAGLGQNPKPETKAEKFFLDVCQFISKISHTGYGMQVR